MWVTQWEILCYMLWTINCVNKMRTEVKLTAFFLIPSILGMGDL